MILTPIAVAGLVLPHLLLAADAPVSDAPASDAVAASAAAVNPEVGEPASYLPSRNGPVGLYRMSTAEVGPPLHLRVGIHGEFFATDNFLVQGDHDTELLSTLALGFTPVRYLEIFAGLTVSSNRNERPAETNRRDPEVIKSWGDLHFGPKLAIPIGPGTAAGFELGVRLPPSTSTLSFAPSATSLWLGPLFTMDLRKLADVPLRFHANLSYYIDNSRNLSNLDGTTPTTRSVSMFAYGMAASRFRLAVGADTSLEKLTRAVPMQPFVEYHAEVITADKDAAFATAPVDGGRDRHWLTFGLRARVYGGITVDAGVDVRLRSTAIQYGPPLPPYDVMLGAAYPFDIDSFRRPVVVTRTVEKPVLKEVAPAPADGEIAGTVRDGKEGRPLGGAVVALKGHPHARVATDPDGTFRLQGVPPGPAELEVTAPAFETERATTAVTAGRLAEVTVSMTPKASTGLVRGKIVDAGGHGVEASLHFAGAEMRDTRSDSQGAFAATLLPGVYRLAAQAPTLASKHVVVDVVAGQERQLELPLHAPNPDVTIVGDEITLRAPIRFKAGTPRLGPKDQQELDGVAGFLADHPEIRVLRVEAHWDSSAGLGAKTMTDKQAQAVKDYLVSKGVADPRVEASGQGADHPLVPSIGGNNRAKNRRLELHLVY
jgi:outer membrane protein OmpA-like peptidoglycan-associated protein